MDDRLDLEEETVERRPPRNLVPGDEGLFAHEYTRRIPSARSKILTGVQVLSNGMLTRGLHLLTQSFATRPSAARSIKRAVRALQYGSFPSSRSTVPRGLFVTDEFSNGYFHWFCDVIPRLEALAKDHPEELRERTLLVPAMAHFAYVDESLAPYHLGQIRTLKPREIAFCRDLLAVAAVAPTGNYRPRLMKAARDRYRAFFPGTGRGRKLFISRSGAAYRRIANEGDLVPVLERHGVERVSMETFPFSEQVKLLGSADVLVGNHGAGLTNMLWMPPGARVLELRRGGDRENNCYFSLASALDLEYFYLGCGAVEEQESTHVADIRVDPEELDNALSMMDGEK
jgi:capsular polysaccharide biosynthesis protein